MTCGSASRFWASLVKRGRRARARGSASRREGALGYQLEGLVEDELGARALGRHPSRPPARAPGPTAGGHGGGPPRIESGAGFGWGGGLTQMPQARFHRQRVGDEGDEPHVGSAQPTAQGENRIDARQQQRPQIASGRGHGGVWRRGGLGQGRRGLARQCDDLRPERGVGSARISLGKEEVDVVDRNLSVESRGFDSLPVTANHQPEASLACECGNALREA